MIAVKGEEIKVEDMPVHMHHKQTTTKKLKSKGEIPTGMVHAGHIK